LVLSINQKIIASQSLQHNLLINTRRPFGGAPNRPTNLKELK